MSHHPDTPSDPVDVRRWLSGIRVSAFTLIMLGLVVLAAFVLVPTASTYLAERQRITALEASIAVSEEQIAELERERERWDDPTYVRTQARERLYYVRPGEVVYIVDNDLDPARHGEDLPVSDQVQERQSDWMTLLLRQTVEAGLAEVVAPR